MHIKLLIIFSVIGVQSFAQEALSLGARAEAMAQATVSAGDIWSYYSNPGSLAILKECAVSSSYSNRFLLKELQSQSLVYVQPIKAGVLSFGASFNGFEVYRNLKIGMGYGLRLTDKLYAGIQLNYHRMVLSNFYGSRAMLTSEAGIYGNITEKWTYGASVYNLGRTELTNYDRKPTVVKIGSQFELSNAVLFLLEAEKSVYFPLRLKAAVEYEVLKDFFFRTGIASKPLMLTYGFGYKYKRIQIDLANAYQQIGAWSPTFSFNYHFKK
jgi:hypothetical protein